MSLKRHIYSDHRFSKFPVKIGKKPVQVRLKTDYTRTIWVAFRL